MDKSNEVRPEQRLNIEPILVTFEVSKLDTSNEVRPEQPWNTLLIPVTEEVSKLDTSNEASFEQPLNIEPILVTFEVSTKFKPLISVSLLLVVILHELIFIGL